jgi:hypothetical protein
MVSAGWLLVKDSAANLERLDARVGDAPLVSEGKLLSSLYIRSAIKLEVFKD